MSQPRISQIERPESLATRAYQAIRRAVQSGELVRDTFYSESDLAQSMGISRTPVREALIELAREGLVEIVPQRGFRLRERDDEERREVFELRNVLEAYVVDRLARSATAQDVGRLRRLIERQAKHVDDPETFLTVDEEFHLLMPQLVGLERAHQMIVTLRGAMWLLGSNAVAAPERIPAIIDEHTAVIDAIAAGDPEAAVKSIRSHVDSTARATAS